MTTWTRPNASLSTPSLERGSLPALEAPVTAAPGLQIDQPGAARAGTPEEVEGALRAAHSQLEIVIAGDGWMG